MKTRILSVLLPIFTFIPSVNAGSVAGTGGATEVTQGLILLQHISHLAQQAIMLQNQIKDITGLDKAEWGKGIDNLNQLAGIVSKGQAISYTLKNVELAFSQKFPSYKSTTGAIGYAKEFESWSHSTMDSIKAALGAAGMQSDMFADEEQALAKIRDMTSTADGTVKAVQAGAMIAAQTVEQLQKLRQLHMAQMQAHAAFMGKAEAKAAKEKMISDAHFLPFTPSPAKFSSRGGKN